MINYIWAIIFILGLVIGIGNGRGEIISKALTTSASSTVEFIIKLTAMLCLWCGIMNIANKSGLSDKLSRILKPLLVRIFKNVKSPKLLDAIVMNITSNMLGLSNAATPFGLKAMEEMQKVNDKKDVATDDMALFLVLNGTCIQLIPTTIISIRASFNSKNPAEIIFPTIIATAVASIMGVIYCKILQKFF
ncbi:MAG TPA: nucleoside recognition domain-containing protein [Clostridiaceae bacterium]